MSLSRDSRQERKLKWLLRSQFRFKQGIERIDFEEDVLNKAVQDFKAGKPVLGLEAGEAFDIRVVDEDSDSSEGQDSCCGDNGEAAGGCCEAPSDEDPLH